MALMDKISSEALARRASVLTPGQTLKSWPFRFGGFGSAGGKWWSRARSAASLSFFESGLSYGETGSVSGGLGVTLNMIFNSMSDADTPSPTKRMYGQPTSCNHKR